MMWQHIKFKCTKNIGHRLRDKLTSDDKYTEIMLSKKSLKQCFNFFSNTRFYSNKEIFVALDNFRL